MVYWYVQHITFCYQFWLICLLVQRLQSEKEPVSLLVSELLLTISCRIALKCFFLEIQGNFQGNSFFFFFSHIASKWSNPPEALHKLLNYSHF